MNIIDSWSNEDELAAYYYFADPFREDKDLLPEIAKNNSNDGGYLFWFAFVTAVVVWCSVPLALLQLYWAGHLSILVIIIPLFIWVFYTLMFAGWFFCEFMYAYGYWKRYNSKM
jgi:hypothetical protein